MSPTTTTITLSASTTTTTILSAATTTKTKASQEKVRSGSDVIQSHPTLLIMRILSKSKGFEDIPTVLPPGYHVNVRCEFHSGAPDHSIESFKALKYKVQDLIDSKVITFTPNDSNVNNPMPPHNNSNVNKVEIDNGRRLLTSVDELKTPLIEIKNVFMKSNAFPVCSKTCEKCLINP